MKTRINLMGVLGVIAFIVLLATLLLAYDTHRLVARPQHRPEAAAAQPLVLPLSFLKNEPACANKLMEEINVRNVHVVQGWLGNSSRTP